MKVRVCEPFRWEKHNSPHATLLPFEQKPTRREWHSTPRPMLFLLATTRWQLHHWQQFRSAPVSQWSAVRRSVIKMQSLSRRSSCRAAFRTARSVRTEFISPLMKVFTWAPGLITTRKTCSSTPSHGLLVIKCLLNKNSWPLCVDLNCHSQYYASLNWAKLNVIRNSRLFQCTSY